LTKVFFQKKARSKPLSCWCIKKKKVRSISAQCVWLADEPNEPSLAPDAQARYSLRRGFQNKLIRVGGKETPSHVEGFFSEESKERKLLSCWCIKKKKVRSINAFGSLTSQTSLLSLLTRKRATRSEGVFRTN
jgi:hypothetical protein